MKNKNFTYLFILFLIAINVVGFSYVLIPDNEEKGTRKIYLIRHGEYDQADTSDSNIGKKLTPLGIAQARLVSARL